MKNFGKMTFSPETVTQHGQDYNVLFLRDENGVDWFDLVKDHPHPFYIAVNADGVIFSMEPDYQAIQTEGVLIGIDSDFGFTRGQGGTVYGKFWNGTAIIENPPEPELTPEEQRALMPPISKRQLRLTLVRNGISLSDLDAAILAMGDEAVIEWQDASEYRRLHPLLNQVAAHLSLTQEQVDTMWLQALTA